MRVTEGGKGRWKGRGARGVFFVCDFISRFLSFSFFSSFFCQIMVGLVVDSGKLAMITCCNVGLGGLPLFTSPGKFGIS